MNENDAHHPPQTKKAATFVTASAVPVFWGAERSYH